MNIAIAQSGGPTCAINASLVGAFSQALKTPEIDAVFGSINGIEGIIKDNLINLKNYRLRILYFRRKRSNAKITYRL